MNLDAAAIVLRPRSVTEVLDLALKLCMGPAMRTYARLSVWVLLPVYLGCLALRFGAGVRWSSIWLLALASATILEGPFTIAVSRILFSEPMPVGRTLRLLAGRLPAYAAGLLMLVALVAMVSWTFLLIPVAYGRMLFVYEVSLLEGVSRGMYARCQQLLRGRGSAVIGFATMLLMARMACVVGADLLGNSILADILQLGHPLGTMFLQGGSPFALAGLFVSVPFFATARFLQYIDTRTRSDGWDVQLRFMAVAAGRQKSGRSAA